MWGTLLKPLPALLPLAFPLGFLSALPCRFPLLGLGNSLDSVHTVSQAQQEEGKVFALPWWSELLRPSCHSHTAIHPKSNPATHWLAGLKYVDMAVEWMMSGLLAQKGCQQLHHTAAMTKLSAARSQDAGFTRT